MLSFFSFRDCLEMPIRKCFGERRNWLGHKKSKTCYSLLNILEIRAFECRKRVFSYLIP